MRHFHNAPSPSSGRSGGCEKAEPGPEPEVSRDLPVAHPLVDVLEEQHDVAPRPAPGAGEPAAVLRQAVRRAAAFVQPSRSLRSQPKTSVAATAPTICARINPGAWAGTMPEKVSVRLRAIVTAGLAKEVEEVNQ